MEDTIMEVIASRRPCFGMDVGKRSHWACLVTEQGEIALNRPVANSERDLDDLFSALDPRTLMVVDQVRNMGLLPLSRARLAGLEVKYLTGAAMHKASRLFAGDARTDGRFGEYYRRCRDRGMSHGKALKATARKRLKVIYVAMRDKVPCTA